MRLLPVIRLSIETDETTSPERQLDKIQTFSRLGDHELVPITEADYDLNVSGSVSPFERPGLGPWLKDDRLDEWDGLCVAKLDRVTRSLFDFVTLISWLEARGKTLICIDPMLDLSTPAGRAFASITATFAQFERETIAARVRDAYLKLQATGKYAGGQVPFGYRPVKLTKSWGYEPDPVYGPVVAELFERYAGFESLGSLTRWLNESDIPTPWNVTRLRGKKPPKDTIWKVTSVRKILASHAALGATIKTDGTLVRDEDGVVVYRADALVSRDVWERAQARLAANPVSARVNTWTLTQVVFCTNCEGAMYGSTTRYGDKTYMYYACVHSLRRDGVCTARRVKAAELETAIADELRALVGDVELTENKVLPGRDYSEDIARVAEQIGHLFSQIQVEALTGIDVREKQEMLLRAQEELVRLHALKPVQARVEPVRTGQTFSQRWESLNAAGRNEFLRSSSVRATVEYWDGSMPNERTPELIAVVNKGPVSIMTPPGGIALPEPGTERTVTIYGEKMRVVLDIGKLAELRKQAATFTTPSE